MATVEQYKICLKYILADKPLLTRFEVNGKEYDTTNRVLDALNDLRTFIVSGAWTKNQYQRFVMLNITKSSEQIASMYSGKTYKASSTRTIRTDGIHRLMKVIPLEYLLALYKGDPYSGADYMNQCQACKYFAYIAKRNLSMNDLSLSYKSAVQMSVAQAKKCTLDECTCEIRFLALNYLGYLESMSTLDEGKLLYINSLLENGMNVDMSESDAAILLSLSDTINQLTRWFQNKKSR